MMPILGTHVSTTGGVQTAPLRAKEIPVRAIQLFAKNNNQWLAKTPLTNQEIDDFKKNREICDVVVAFSHAGYLINLASPDSKNHELSLQSLTQELERAEDLGLDFVVLHPGAHVGSGLETGVKKIVASINQVFGGFSKLKTRLLLETTAGQGTSIGYRFEELASILENVEAKERMGVCLDTAHVFAAGYDIRDQESYKTMWKKFDQTIGLKQLYAIHLNDSKTDLGSRVDRHEHIGKGKIGLEGFRFLMQDARFTKLPMVLETPKGDDFVRYDQMNLKELQDLMEPWS